MPRATRVWSIVGCISVAVVALTAQGGFVPAQYREGALPPIPIQALGGGEAFLELTVTSRGVVRAVRTLRATPPFTEAMSAAARRWQFRPAEEEMEPEPGRTSSDVRSDTSCTLSNTIF